MNEEALFHDALELPPAARAAFLDDACGGDAALRLRLAVLLEAHDQPGSFLDGLAGSPGSTSETWPSADDLAAPPSQLGPYRLLEPLGEGGMGSVWRAQQEEPVRRLVALKLIKAGMDTRRVIARFEAERQALALMDHPNIARVFDGGVTPAGRPYFVMELVRGEPVTDFCDRHRLPVRDRLELFVAVCRAVQHAHQKGVIHRDLKPSNVLVALDDGKPAPKVIDFGLAKATGPRLTEETMHTGLGTLVGTLEYMSPEQAGVDHLDVDTRSDVYSLGVLLYELLAGSPPFTLKEAGPGGALEMLRVIREEEPPRPSARLGTAEGLPALAAEPRRLKAQVRGELDWIVLKALEKDRNRRYDSASAFAADVERHLRDEPVLACPPAPGYRLRKFVHRNRVPVLAGVLAAAALVAGVVGTTLGLVRATDAMGQKDSALAAAKANENQAKAAQEDAQENLKDALAAVDQMLTRVSQERLAGVPQMEPVRRDLLQGALKFYQKFLQKNGDDPGIRRETAQAYGRVAQIQRQLGQWDESTKSYRKALELLEELRKRSPGDPELRCQLVNLHLNAAAPLIDDGKPDKAARHLREAFRIAEDLAREYPDRPAYGCQLARTANHLVLYVPQARPEEAEKILRRNLDLEKRAPDPDLRAQTYALLGRVLADQRRYAEAEEAYRAVGLLGEQATDYPAGPLAISPDSAWTLKNLADVLAADGREGEAEELYCRAVGLLSKQATDYPAGPHWRNMLAVAHLGHADLLTKLGREAEAEQAYRQALDVYERLAADFPSNHTLPQHVFDRCIHLSRFLAQGGRPLEAQEVLGRAGAALAKLPDDPNGGWAHRRGLVSSHLGLARLLTAEGKAPEAQASFDKAVAIQLALERDFADNPDFRRELANAHAWTAYLLHEDGRAEEAERLYHLAEAHFRQLVAGAPDDVGALMGLAFTCHHLGRLLDAQPRGREAGEAFAHAVETLTKVLALSPTNVEARGMKGHGHRMLVGYVGTAREKAEHCRAAIELFGGLYAEFPDRADHLGYLASTQRWLGRALGQDNKPQEAEGAFRRAIELYEGLAAKFPNSPYTPGELPLAYSDLGYQLAAGGPATATEEVLRQAVASFSKAIELDPGAWKAWNGRGEAHAQLREWDKAGRDFAKSVELAPGNPVLHYRHALARLALADTERYRDACAGMFTQFGTSSDPNAAFWTVWACVLAPDAVADWGPVVQLAEKAVADDPSNGDKLQNLGAVLYRAGRYREAAKRLEEAEAAFPETQSPRASPVYTWLFQAMTLHRLGHPEEAQQQLRKAGNAIDEPSGTTNVADAAWNRRLTLRLLRQEAEDLLKRVSGARGRETEREPD